MSQTVIQVEEVSKQYRLGAIGGRRLVDDVNSAWAKFRGKADPLSKVDGTKNLSVGEKFWALNEISFDVKQGEALGIIGRNGAGKSTLLKILSRITSPTSGEVRLKGRIASLLEVGTGFHPELTGRENVFLNGAILGMTKDEIRKHFDEIVAFSDVERFIDTPVKRYSSGMKVRLAFAVAAHLEAEILIVDEVLAVGDAEFQKKCLGKMGDVTSQGRTILFVSHNMVAVQTLCKSAIFLSNGRLTDSGDPSSIISKYLESSITQDQLQEWKTPESAPGNEFVKISRIRVFPEGDRESGLITMQTPVNVETKFWRLSETRNAYLVYHLVDEQGIIVLTTSAEMPKNTEGEYVSSFQIPGKLLNSGYYTLRFRILENGRQTYDNHNMASFTVVDIAPRNRSNLGREPGVIQLHLPWSTMGSANDVSSSAASLVAGK